MNKIDPNNFVLSIIIPAFNEIDTIENCLNAVLATSFKKEILIVDDGSTDGTREYLKNLSQPDIVVKFHEKNQGKGSAIQTALDHMTGDIVLIQDADLEYDPSEYPILLKPILDDRADVVFGSRFSGYGAHRLLYYWHYLGNKFLTTLSNFFTNINQTDMECCYKVFRREAISDVRIQEKRFGFEPEITAKMAKKKLRIYEVPVSYYGRTYEAGKKITWKDGVRAIWCILKYNVCRPKH
ncbi:glycosyltransferase group 2 family protein [Candidatus Magnetomorum sp. HK-1]|nr:glycosyltransferase group 2 family protein [Candidatus Magnetomorum sp. HK-1]